VKAAVLIIEGSNCEAETKQALERVGVPAEIIHLKQLTGDCSNERKRALSDYDLLFLPGGWSAGDYIRAGAIFAARAKSKLGGQLADFVDDGKLVVGVCNGFQILTEVGLLPGFDGMSETPEAALAINKNSRFQCRPTYLKHESQCKATSGIDVGRVLQVPVAHAEGRLTFGGNEKKALARLKKNNQIIFTYCMPDGSPAGGEFPWNPNGSLNDIAGISNPGGNVLGMMPHPERVIDGIQKADWTRSKKSSTEGDGLAFFKSIAVQLKK